ncbi:Tyrosine kinase specific for activated [Rhizoctonia solani]|uniref:Tyrosine kinase specific for activated n=1 Tax=Rhizoctonia solani TaxID=456999 RepID=A0A8H8PA44_9AGAM|nr:Tyrosine kinase specific for activated [Rhizoctonia solani]QRW26571.1 Tyrosine kinase specific for activated [Rhizoctonia solani]
MPINEIMVHLQEHGCKNVTEDLDLHKCSQYPVASGGFGDVFYGTLRNGSPVAIKCLRIFVGTQEEEGKRQLRRAAHEIYIWSKCDHPHVLDLVGVAQYQERIAMVSPWMPRGNLTWYLSQNPHADRHQMCVQITDGVAYLHDRGIVHGDIKGLNVLVSEEHIPMLTDFGTSSLSNYTLQFTRGTGSGVTATVRYTAPEILMEETKLTTEGDIYGLGMTMLEITTGRPPYHESVNEAIIVRKITTGVHPARPKHDLMGSKDQSNVLWKLFENCWAFDPCQRPKAIELLDKLRTLVRPTMRFDVIEETMTTGEILLCLYYHGCKTVTEAPNLQRWPPISDPESQYMLSRNDELAFKGAILSGFAQKSSQEHFQQSLAYEAYIWSRCNHPHILNLIGVARIQDSLAMVSPWIGYGRLTDYITRNKGIRDCCKVSTQVADAVAYLHSNQIIHWNINISNLLVADHECIKLCGFEKARIYRQELLGFPGLLPDSCESMELFGYLQGIEIGMLGTTILSIIISGRSGIGRSLLSSEFTIRGKLERPDQYFPINDQGNLLWSLVNNCWNANEWLRPTAATVRDAMSTFSDESIWKSDI